MFWETEERENASLRSATRFGACGRSLQVPPNSLVVRRSLNSRKILSELPAEEATRPI